MGCASSAPAGGAIYNRNVAAPMKADNKFKSHHLSLDIQARFLAADQSSMIQAEYIWIGGNNELRCKTKTLTKAPSSPADLPVWNFDGSSTDQAPGTDSEVLLVPCAIYRDPFRAGPSGSSPNILVLCDCYKPDPDAPKGVGAPIPTNTRVACNEIMEKVKGKEPWFGIEQEYTLFEPDGVTPYGWPDCSNGLQYPDRPQGPYYCSIGTENAYGRPVVEAHYRACMCTHAHAHTHVHTRTHAAQGHTSAPAVPAPLTAAPSYRSSSQYPPPPS